MSRVISRPSRFAQAAIAGVALVGVSLTAPGSSPARAETVPPGGGDGSQGYRLASAWCRGCHAIESAAVNTTKPAPDFVAVANMPSTTELSLKVFLRSNHRSMPNFIIRQNDIEDIVTYILSLKHP